MTSRRRLLSLAIAGGLAVSACGGGGSTAPSTPPGSSTAGDPCTSPPRADGVTLTVASYGGAYQEAQRTGWMEPYAALTGVTFQESEESSNATIKAQVEAG